MGTAFMGELRIVSFNFPPKGWANCNGQLMPINQNQALFSLLGTMYGGNGQVTFALPDLRGCVPMHVGGGHIQGEKGGSDSVTLNVGQMPAHTHAAIASTGAPNTAVAPGSFWATGGGQIYGTPASLVTMAPQTSSNVGGSQPHENRPPILTLNFIINLQGIFPSRN